MKTQQDALIPGPAGRLAVRAKGLNTQPEQAVVLVQGSNLTGQAMLGFSWSAGNRYSVDG
jgi:hypothetical protein